MFKIITVLTCFFSMAVQANDASKAADFFANRDYDEVGKANAQKAVNLYVTLEANESDPDIKMSYKVRTAEAHYFLGSARSDDDMRKAHHRGGMDSAQAVIDSLGIQNAHELTPEELEQLTEAFTDIQLKNAAEAFYFRATNLAAWGKLNGINASVTHLPEVRGLLRSVRGIGYESMQNYGPDRAEGRIQFVLPDFLGGSTVESEALLKNAVIKTLAAGQRYSVNGYNNVYLAETLYANGKENKAKELLKAFINADPETLNQDIMPENRQALVRAKELATDWDITL